MRANPVQPKHKTRSLNSVSRALTENDVVATAKDVNDLNYPQRASDFQQRSPDVNVCCDLSIVDKQTSKIGIVAVVLLLNGEGL
jgi:hypothetical protein